jgi:Uma2 family endonuclease
MAIRAEDLPHFSVNEYLALAEAAPEALERTELIDGVIYRVSPESFLHSRAILWISKELEERYPGRCVPGGSVRFPDASMWQPDVCVLRNGAQVAETRDSYPSIDDVGWAIEVSLTTNQRDLGIKFRRYAQAGLPEYWVVNPEEGGWVLVHTNPVGETYRTVQRVELPGGYRDLEFDES